MYLGGVLEALGASWGRLGAAWRCLEAVLGRVLVHLGAVCGHGARRRSPWDALQPIS